MPTIRILSFAFHYTRVRRAQFRGVSGDVGR
jgi:hypothetical protein